ncbi:hypothetical protein [Amaricoccus sp.]|nr:hypothetical protein [Amaricoccus sp.]MBP7000705.1 hypothetical protein [Amaricoccus sp.]
MRVTELRRPFGAAWRDLAGVRGGVTAPPARQIARARLHAALDARRHP